MFGFKPQAASSFGKDGSDSKSSGTFKSGIVGKFAIL
jgi:hypothetical protein